MKKNYYINITQKLSTITKKIKLTFPRNQNKQTLHYCQKQRKNSSQRIIKLKKDHGYKKHIFQERLIPQLTTRETLQKFQLSALFDHCQHYRIYFCILINVFIKQNKKSWH